MPGTSADVMIWVWSFANTHQCGPSRIHRRFFDFEIGAHDGTYKGRTHTVVPYIGWKTLSEDEQEYNDIHGFYRARVEHFFARLWQWRTVRNVWTHSAMELHGHVCILLHLSTGLYSQEDWVSTLWTLASCALVWLRRRQLLRRRKMMMVCVANCVATVLVIYPSVALAI